MLLGAADPSSALHGLADMQSGSEYDCTVTALTYRQHMAGCSDGQLHHHDLASCTMPKAGARGTSLGIR